MILSAVILIGLLASTTNSSAVKGRTEDYSHGTKSAAHSGRSYTYEHRERGYAAKGAIQEAVAAPAEQAKIAEPEYYQQHEETKSSDKQQSYYEADCKGEPCQKSAVTKTEERVEEQSRLEEYSQQREEAPVQQVKQEVKSNKQEQRVVYESPKIAFDKYEARPQVREEVAPVVPVVEAAPAPVPVATGPIAVARAQVKGESAYSKTQERHEEHYAVQAPEQQPAKVEEAHREELKASAKTAPAVQRAEPEQPRIAQQQETLFQQQQQAVELTRNQDYEQHRYEEQAEQRAEEHHQYAGQVHEEQQLVKGGLRAPGAEAEPYAFDYSVEGSSRRESGDQNGVVRGQYTLQNPDGTHRVVDYVADHEGFRAQVRTNEFGTEGQQQQQQVVRASAGLEGKTYHYEPAPVAVVQAAAAPVKPAPIVQVAEVVRAKPAQVIYDESARFSSSYKEAVKSAAEPAQAGLKTPPLVAHEPEPYKSQHTEEAVQQRSAVESVKSAELRTPKAISQSRSAIARASGFESATAHRPVVHTVAVPVAAPVPVTVPVSVRHVPVPQVSAARHHLSPVRGYQSPHYHRQQPQRQYHSQPVVVPVGVHAGVAHSQFQHDRYPPASYRRDQIADPRVSFYAGHFEEEQPAGFEQPADLI